MDVSTVMTKGRTGKLQLRGLFPAFLLAVGYYWGARIGFPLASGPAPPFLWLWPPYAVLLAGLLISHPQSWWLILLAVFPSHLATQLNGGAPLGMVLGWFAINCGEAMLGAIFVRSFLKQRLGFDSLQHVTEFLCCCVFFTPFVFSFIDATLIKALGWATGDFWQWWRLRFFSNVAAMLIFVPAILTWNTGVLPSIRKAPRLRQLEGALLAAVLSGVVGLVFIASFADSGLTALVPLLLYVPLPILLWIAIRFNPFIACMSLLLFACLAVWGTAHGQGPFVEGAPFGNALSLQLFLSGVSISLLLLSAVIQEWRKMQESLRHHEEKLIVALAERTIELHRVSAALKSEAIEREKAMEAARRSEECFSRTFRLSPDAMALSSGIQGRILDVNERWQTLFGYGRAEAIGSTTQQLNLFASEQDFAVVLERLGESGAVRDIEVRIRDRQGGIRHAALSGGEIDAGARCSFITILRDVTDQRRAECEAQRQREQLTHLTRVAVLGELSGALAHELNQPLAAILTNAQAARRFMSREQVDWDEIREILDDIVDEDKRAGEVIRRLRALFMKGEQKMQPLEINALVQDAIEITHSDLIERKVPVKLQLGSCHGVVQGDRVQLQQVLLNLIINACEAMSCRPPNTRRLSLTTGSGMDGHVQIAVTDSGPGIPSDVMDKVFESFFTTKAHGMGFGLSISRAIISEHGGRIEATNNSCGGATFRIILPAHVGDLP